VADPPLHYSGEFPLDSAPALRRLVGVYWRHQVAGRVIRRTPGVDSVLVDIRLKPEFAQRALGSQLQLFRGRKDPSQTWIAIIPRRAAERAR
jgi:hypothetical protein